MDAITAFIAEETAYVCIVGGIIGAVVMVALWCDRCVRVHRKRQLAIAKSIHRY